MHLKIRDVTNTDIDIVSDFSRELISELAGVHASKEEFDMRAECILNDNQCSGFVAFDYERPVGLMMLCEAAAMFAGGRYGIITELYVVPAYRSQGIAVMLLEEAKHDAKRQGWKRLEVGAPSQPEWNRTLKFYESNGFVITGPRLRLVFS
jgi:GNAT superfamily N-acetyltransferase